MTKKFIISIDQGTTSSRAVIFDLEGRIVSKAQKEFKQIYPKPGWVEHDPMQIYSSQTGVIREAMDYANIDVDSIISAGITNQRETTVVWDRKTGEPIYNAIVWQCRRTSDIVEQIHKDEMDEKIREKTGLVADAYFSATKIKWILDTVEGARERAERGELAFGTIDSWLIWHFSKGKVHKTDYTNASRTMLFNIKTLEWDEELLEYFDIPKSLLPEVCDCSGDLGYIDASILGKQIPITGCAGDQQSSLFGHGCYNPGDAKNTYGTGCFLLMNTGEKLCKSDNGLLTTIAWSLDGKVNYALEGSIFMGGAIVKWLRDELEIIKTSEETEQIASSLEDNGGVYMVPAFTGLGAPYWDMYARGIIIGLTRGSSKAHIVRAALESIAYSTKDVLDLMEDESGIKLNKLKVDGGASNNDFLMQFQSDLLDTSILKAREFECTAKGAFLLSGIGAGVFDGIKTVGDSKEYSPKSDIETNKTCYKNWKRAVERSRNWEEFN